MKLSGALLCLVIGFAAVKAFSISGRASFDASRPLTGSSLSFSGIPGLNLFSNLFGIRRPTTSTTKIPSRPSSTTHRPTSTATSTSGPSSTSSSTNGPTSSESTTNSPSSSTTSGQGSSTSGSSTNVPTSSDLSTNVPTSSDLSTNVPTSSDLSTNVPTSSDLSTNVPTISDSSTTDSSSSSTSGQGSSTSGSSTTQSGSSTYAAMPLRMPNIMDMFSVPSVDSFFSPNSVPSMPTMPGFSNLLDNSAIPGVDEAINEAREHVTEALSLGANFEISLDQAVQDALASNDPSAALRTLAQAVLDAYVTVAANCPLIVVGLRVLQEGIRLAGEIARSAENIILGTTASTTVSTTTVTSTT